jgi:hypothetical protein
MEFLRPEALATLIIFITGLYGPGATVQPCGENACWICDTGRPSAPE